MPKRSKRRGEFDDRRPPSVGRRSGVFVVGVGGGEFGGRRDRAGGLSKFQQNPAKNGRVLTKFNKIQQKIFVKFCSEQNPTNFNKANKRRAKPTKRSKNEQTRTNARRDADFAAVRTRKRRRRFDRLRRGGGRRSKRAASGGRSAGAWRRLGCDFEF